MRLFSLLCLFSLVLVLISVSSLYIKMNFFESSSEVNSVTFRIDKGEKLSSIGKRLKEKNLIISNQLFEYWAVYKNLDKTIRFGEFVLNNRMSIMDILKKITLNSALTYKIVIRECMTNWEIIKLLNQKYFLYNDLEDLNSNFDLGLDEGVFAPNTYYVSFNTKFSDVLDLMRREQTQILSEQWASRNKEIPINDQLELLILASIIEKEAADIAEMSTVSSVFVNRLSIGMRLQSDPTVIYGLDFGNINNRKSLTRKDLKVVNGHNTYRISGLPTTPICNPSKSALIASANPANTNFLYFVLSKSGGHVFSQHFEEHKKNVVLWRTREIQ